MPRALERQSAADAVSRSRCRAGLLNGLYAKDGGRSQEAPSPLLRGAEELEFLSDLAAAEALGEERFRSRRARGWTELVAEQRGESARAEDRQRRPRALRSSDAWWTSDPAANTDAAIHVAHAITVHAMERELDYMTVVDDLKRRDDLERRDKRSDSGAAGVFDMELTSGLYYGYVVVDVGLLVKNLSGDREIAAKVVEHLVHLVAQVSPGAKKGSTAPYAWAELMLVEAGTRQPRTLANAFRDPVSLRTNRLLGETVERMGAHLAGLDAAHGGGEMRRQLAVSTETAVADIETMNLDALARWSAATVRGAHGASA